MGASTGHNRREVEGSAHDALSPTMHRVLVRTEKREPSLQSQGYAGIDMPSSMVTT